MKTSLIGIFTLTLGLLFSCSPKGGSDNQSGGLGKPVLLKTPIAFKSTLIGLGTTIDYVSKRVAKASAGNIKVKIYEPGKLVPPLEILDAVSTGKVQAGYSVSGYWTGKLPAAPLFSSTPFGPELGEFLAWLKYGNGEKLYQRMYDQGGYNVKVLVCGVMAPETSGWFVKPVNKPEDLKGLKIRFFGLGGDVYKKLGASPTLLPGGEIFPALEKGAIGATEYSMPAIDEDLGFFKVAKHNYYPGWHQQSTAYELLVNKDVWNGLSEAQQTLLEMACSDATTNSIAEGEYSQFEAMRRMQAKGVELIQWSPEMLKTYEDAWNEVVVELSEKDAFFKEVWEDLQGFRKEYALWGDNAFLPRKSPNE